MRVLYLCVVLECASVSSVCRYIAPEVILGELYGFASDVWSLGILFYVVMCGYQPFQGLNVVRSLPLCLSVCLSVCPSVCLSVCLSVCPSVRVFTV